MDTLTHSAFIFAAIFLGAIIALRCLVMLWTAAVMALGAAMDAVTAKARGLIGGPSRRHMEPPTDGYAEALEILGLKGNPVQADVERRHMALISLLHADVNAGKTAWFTARVSAARDVIFKRHGWT